MINKAFTIFFFLIAGLAGSDAIAKSTELNEAVFVDESFFKNRPRLSFGGDPFFRPPGSYQDATPQPPLKLQAVIYSERNPSAVINSQVITKGDRLSESIKVIDIGRNFVLIEDHGRVKELRLSGVKK